MHAMISLHESPTPRTLELASETRSARFWPLALLLMIIGAVGMLAVVATFFLGVPQCVYAHASFDGECVGEHLAR